MQSSDRARALSMTTRTTMGHGEGLVGGLKTNGIKRGEHVWFLFANQHELQKEIVIVSIEKE